MNIESSTFEKLIHKAMSWQRNKVQISELSPMSRSHHDVSVKHRKERFWTTPDRKLRKVEGLLLPVTMPSTSSGDPCHPTHREPPLLLWHTNTE